MTWAETRPHDTTTTRRRHRPPRTHNYEDHHDRPLRRLQRAGHARDCDIHLIHAGDATRRSCAETRHERRPRGGANDVGAEPVNTTVRGGGVEQRGTAAAVPFPSRTTTHSTRLHSRCAAPRHLALRPRTILCPWGRRRARTRAAPTATTAGDEPADRRCPRLPDYDTHNPRHHGRGNGKRQ